MLFIQAINDVQRNHQHITRRQILDSTKLKEFADDNFKLMKMVKSSPKVEENIVEKGEIARYEQFLFSHSVFKRLVM